MPTDKLHTVRLSLAWDDEPSRFTIAFVIKPEHGLRYFRDQLEMACNEIKCVSDEQVSDYLEEIASSSPG